MYRYLTCESVGSGHPDKVADRISDTILDFLLKKDKNTKAGIEVLVSHQKIIVAGEVFSETYFDSVVISYLVCNALKDIGYIDEHDRVVPRCGINEDFEIINLIKSQSPDIRKGVVRGLDEIGAGDQGMMIGYATNDTESKLPLPLDMSHSIMKHIEDRRKKLGDKTSLLPDGKCQVTVVYKNNKPVHIDTVVVSNQTRTDDRKIYETEILKIVDCLLVYYRDFLYPLAPEEKEKFEETKILINPTGSFLVGGPLGDVGLTGRKIVVDQYGGFAPVGGGAFSGKDPTKVDRSGAYMARCLAINILKAVKCNEVFVELAYAIGVSDPVSINIKLDDGYSLSEYWKKKVSKMEENILNSKICTPKSIIERFKLLDEVRYTNYSSYGHFGREAPWEVIYKDIQEILK